MGTITVKDYKSIDATVTFYEGDTVAVFRSYIKSQLGLDTTGWELDWTGESPPVRLLDDKRTLSSYGVRNTHYILLRNLNPPEAPTVRDDLPNF